MTIEEARVGLKRLQASYPNMTKLDDLAVSAYLEEIGLVKWDDFAAGMKELVRSSKFFPSISEIIIACDEACAKRLSKRDHVEREERLALQSAEDKIMDPGSDVHKSVQGPQHQRFLDLISGREKVTEPDWMRRARKEAREEIER